ncbi:MAG: rhamnulokinase family protein [Acidobacteriota bacterium]
MSSPFYIAVDLGAGSGRVFFVGFDPLELVLEELHRFHYPPREEDGRLRWDFDLIFENIIRGLSLASERAEELGRPIRSIGVDTWAVDYGLLDDSGKLVANPICYRDTRIVGTMERTFAIVPRSEIFEKTGIQFLNFNTLYQLFTEKKDIPTASQLLLLPDLVNFFLTGNVATEYTNATTTQMVNAVTGKWDIELLNQLEIPTSLLTQIVPNGTDIGKLDSEVSMRTGLFDVRAIAPATHDTASAVAAAPLDRGWAYISSGTWSLVGVERHSPLIGKKVLDENFTNEGGAYGSFRFLKNVMGLWIFESCRREWEANGFDLSYEEILGRIEAIGDFETLIFPDDERFLNPLSMMDAIRKQLSESGQSFADDPVLLSKTIFDSLAFRYASVLGTIEQLTDEELIGIQILGGGGRNGYLNQMTADATRMQVHAGLFEATVVGNALVQAISAGRFASLEDGRNYIAKKIRFEISEPRRSAAIDHAKLKYAAIESQFSRQGHSQ